MRENVTLKNCGVVEVVFILDLLKENSIPCSLEMNLGISSDPVLGIYKEVFTARLEGAVSEDPTLTLEFGNERQKNGNIGNIGFDVEGTSFGKEITSHQIFLFVGNDDCSVWINTSEVPQHVIEIARSYVEPESLPESLKKNSDAIELDGYETALIRFIRTLEFDDLLDVMEGIEDKCVHAQRMMTKKIVTANPELIDGWKKRAERLKELSELLGVANADYRNTLSEIGAGAHE